MLPMLTVCLFVTLNKKKMMGFNVLHMCGSIEKCLNVHIIFNCICVYVSVLRCACKCVYE